MSQVMIAPNGVKGRTQANKRYIVAGYTDERVFTHKRTASFETAVRELKRLAHKGVLKVFIWDQSTASIVPYLDISQGRRITVTGQPTRYGRVP